MMFGVDFGKWWSREAKRMVGEWGGGQGCWICRVWGLVLLGGEERGGGGWLTCFDPVYYY